MSIYELLAIMALLLAFLKDYIRNSRLLAAFFILILTIVAAIRDLSVGTDTDGYYDAFISATTVDSLRTSADEPLFALYTYLCQQYLNYDWFMLINYGIMILSFLWVAFKKSTNLPLSVFIFITCGFYLGSFNGMREYIATAITFVALYVLESEIEKKNRLFFLLTIIATLIHNTGLLVLLVYFIRNRDIPNRIQLTIVVSSFIIGFFLSDYFWSFIPSFVSDVGRLGKYLEYEEGSGGRTLITNLGVNIMFLFIMYLMDKDRQRSVFYKAYFVSMIIFNLVGSMNVLTRITNNLAIAQIVIIPIVLSQTKIPIFKYGLLILVLAYSISRFYLRELSNPDILPYIIRPNIEFF